jgi:Ca2+-binding EF-hand superfamily protein
MRERAAVLLSHLFSLFDADGNGDVDSAEMLAGLSVLCGGSQDDKVETTQGVG